MQVVLLAPVHDREMSVSDVQVWINAERYGKKDCTVLRVAIEKIPIIEIPVRPRISYGLRSLMYRIIVTLS